MARGEAKVNGQHLTAGDAAAFAPGEAIEVTDTQGAEILLFDLA